MSKKNKVKVAPPAQYTRADAERFLAEIRTLTILRNTVQAAREECLKALDDKFGPPIQEATEKINHFAECLHLYAEQNPDVFGKRRSIVWPHGKFGFRLGTPKLVKKLKAAWASNTMIEKVRAALGGAYIDTTETIDRDGIISNRAEIPKDALKEAGLSVEQENTFYVEPNVEEIENRLVA